MTTDLILNEIEKNKDNHINFLREIIQTNSYNPPGNEKNVAKKIQKFLKSSGIRAEVFPFGENRANLIACLNDNYEGKNLIYNGHMDVVPPGDEEDWKYPPLSAYVKRNKYIFGRGSTDMKGGLVAMIIALSILKKLNLKVAGNLILTSVADEETGGVYGTKWCLEETFLKSIKCDFAVVGEPTGASPLPKAILIGEKGHPVIKITTYGESAHSMAPFLGKNAIYMMSKIIQKLDHLGEHMPKIDSPLDEEKLKKQIASVFPTKEIFERIVNEQPLLKGLIESTTQFVYSLNVINGGLKENVVPDKCEALIDFRLVPGQTVDMVMDALKILINSLGYKVKTDLDNKPQNQFVRLEILHRGEPSVWSDWEKSQQIRDLGEIYENIYKKKAFIFLGPGTTDAHYFRNKGYCTQTVGIGPGNAGAMHVVDENIEINDFLNMIKVYTLFAYKFIK